MEAYVGIHMQYNRDGSVTMTQPNMIREIFRDYNCCPKAYRVPMDSSFNDADQDDSPVVDPIHYMRLLGRLMYVIRTRPDVAYALNRLATRANRATEKDFKALIRVLLYLHHTINLGLRFKRSPNSTENARRLFCFVDAAFATHTDSRSHTGYCFGMGDVAGMFLPAHLNNLESLCPPQNQRTGRQWKQARKLSGSVNSLQSSDFLKHNQPRYMQTMLP